MTLTCWILKIDCVTFGSDWKRNINVTSEQEIIIQKKKDLDKWVQAALQATSESCQPVTRALILSDCMKKTTLSTGGWTQKKMSLCRSEGLGGGTCQPWALHTWLRNTCNGVSWQQQGVFTDRGSTDEGSVFTGMSLVLLSACTDVRMCESQRESWEIWSWSVKASLWYYPVSACFCAKPFLLD